MRVDTNELKRSLPWVALSTFVVLQSHILNPPPPKNVFLFSIAMWGTHTSSETDHTGETAKLNLHKALPHKVKWPKKTQTLSSELLLVRIVGSKPFMVFRQKWFLSWLSKWFTQGEMVSQWQSWGENLALLILAATTRSRMLQTYQSSNLVRMEICSRGAIVLSVAHWCWKFVAHSFSF